MPLDAEFKKHLLSLMAEVAEKTQPDWVHHKNELVGKAVATHNSPAPPIAYKDAELYRMELRISKTIEKYIEAVSIWGYSIDAAFEKDMIQEFWSLTAGPNQLHFPPAIRGQHAQAVSRSYSMERQRLAARLVREGTNRLKELKMKNSHAKQLADKNTINNIFNGPVGNAYIDSSVVQTTNNVAITSQILDDIDRLSEGNSELQTAADGLRNTQIQGGNVIDRLQKWVVLTNNVAGLSEKIHQYYPQIAALISHLKTIMG